TSLVPRSAVEGDAVNEFRVGVEQRVTHVRLCLYPDGGVARLRVHGEVVPDPRLLGGGAIDLGALANGATIAGCSNMFYSSPANLLSPGPARLMGEGWETARRRDDGNDWVEVRLAGPGVVQLAELDTSWFVGNAPGWAALRGRDERDGELELLPRTRLQPDTPHRFTGVLTRAGREQLVLRWFTLLPPAQATQVLTAEGVPVEVAEATVAARPPGRADDLPDA